MNLVYILLLLTIITCFSPQKKYISIVLCSISILTALLYGIINFFGLFAIIGFYAITHIYFQCNINSKIMRVILLIAILTAIAFFALHMIPGIKNTLVINRVAVSAMSMPFTMYLNFDKTIAGVILFINSTLYCSEKSLDIKSIITTSKLLFSCSVILIISCLLSGYIKFDFKIPNILLIWCINNLFFVCLAEEVSFRGIVQNQLMQAITGKYIALILASLVFGFAHLKGGVLYILLATIAREIA